MSDAALPQGVVLSALTPHADDRGVFTEIYREEWGLGCAAIQWNAVRNEPDVLRGVHVHRNHDDYLVPVAGKLVIGLHDVRPDSPTSGLSAMVTIDSAAPHGIVVPTGVAHGFYSPDGGMHIYAVSHYWNMADEMGCRYDCPELGLDWPTTTPKLSDRDRDAGTYAAMVAEWSGSPHPAA